MMQICYKTKVPKVYNEGTRYESRHDEFMMWVCHNHDDAAAIVEELNTNHPAESRGTKINWDEIDHFFLNGPIDPDTFR